MTSATLSHKNTAIDFINLFVWNIKKYKVLLIVYSSLLVFSSPILGALFGASFGFGKNPVPFVTFILLTTGVTTIMTFIIAVMMFDYLHNKRKADIFGSLPCTRRTLFFSRYVTGLVMIIVPYIINMLIVMLMSLGIDDTSKNGVSIQLATIYIGLLVIISMVASYSFTAFIAVCCGTTANTVLTTLLIIFSYPLAIAMLSTIGSSIIPGINLHIGDIPLLSDLFSPYGSSFSGMANLAISCISDKEYNFFAANWQSLVVWLILIVAGVVGCFFLVKKRKTEAAQNSFAFKAPSIIIRFIATVAIGLFVGYIATFSTSLIGTDNYSSAYPDLTSKAWTTFVVFIISSVIAAFLTHLIATVIFNKGFRGFGKSLISFAGVVVFMTALYTSLAFGGFGADKNIPKQDEISYVEIYTTENDISNVIPFSSFFLYNIVDNSYQNPIEKPLIFDNKESINEIIDLHKTVTTNFPPTPYYINQMDNQFSYFTYNQLNYEYNNPNCLKFVYHLKNGMTVERSYSSAYFYNIPVTDKLNKLKFSYSGNTLNKLNQIIKDDNVTIDELEFANEISVDKYYDFYGYYEPEPDSTPYSITQEKIIAEITKSLSADIEEYGTDISNQDDIIVELVAYYTESSSGDDISSISVMLPQSYKRTLTVLSQYGYLTSFDTNREYIDTENIDDYFKLPDSIDKTKLKNIAEPISEKYSVDSEDSWAHIYFENYQFNEQDVYCRVVYSDDEGNLYYYYDMFSDDEKVDKDEQDIYIPYLYDKGVEDKVYQPLIVQLYTDNEYIHTRPIHIDNGYGSISFDQYYYENGTITTEDGETYILFSDY